MIKETGQTNLQVQYAPTDHTYNKKLQLEQSQNSWHNKGDQSSCKHNIVFPDNREKDRGQSGRNNLRQMVENEVRKLGVRQMNGRQQTFRSSREQSLLQEDITCPEVPHFKHKSDP